MFSEREFEAILKRLEDETLDFKSKMSELLYEPEKAKFVKDVLAMYNTPREEPSYIVYGVDKRPDGSYDLKGLDKHIDEEILRSQFTERVYPIPTFSYWVFSYQDRLYGIISIPPRKEGPCIPLKDFPGSRDGRSHSILRQGQVYFRRGSKNEPATPVDIASIVQWFQGKDVLQDNIQPFTSPPWEALLERVYKFDPSRRYILLAAPLEDRYARTQYLAALGKLPWSMVLDFDPDSERQGLLGAVKDTLETRRNLHYVVKSERLAINPERSTYWFFARGLQGRVETLSIGEWKKWKGQYGNEMQEQLKRLAEKINPTPVVCVALWYETSLILHLRTVIEDTVGIWGEESVEFVILTEHRADFQHLEAELDVATIGIPFHQFCSGVEDLTSSYINPEKEKYDFPSSSSSPLLLDAVMRQKLEEELNLVSLSSGLNPPFQEYSRRDFLRGAEAEISWYGLDKGYDIERDKARRFIDELRDALDHKRPALINLYHEPGAGGTTLARRILWNLHLDYPCAILKQCTSDTVERLYALASLTQLSVLLLIDGAQITDGQVEDLFNQLKSRRIPVVLFQVLRRFINVHTEQQTEKTREWQHLPTKLSTFEVGRFVDAFTNVEPDKRRRLEELGKSEDVIKRSAFYFGLETFGINFQGLERYVSSRLDTLSFVQQQIVVFLSIAHHYAQRPMPAQAFVKVLGIPRNRVVDLTKVLSHATCQLLVEGPKGVWRTAHEFVASEMLQQMLMLRQDRRTWRQSLSHWGKAFAEFCRGDSIIPSDEMLVLAERTFIYRDNDELLGTEGSGSNKFAHIIEDIPMPEGRIEVLKKLAECYPEKPHLWAHLGRFYAIVMTDYEKALEYIERALAIQWNDRVLHHMKGVALRHKVYKLFSEEPVNKEEIVKYVKLASDSFEEARKQRPDDPHGYISEAEMLVHVLDRLINSNRDAAEASLKAYMLAPATDSFFKECLGRIEELLEYVRRMREGEGPSIFEQRCRGKLKGLYGEYGQALQVWNSLLNRSDTYRPPLRRQIVWTYLASKGRVWDKLEAKTIQQIITLLEENLYEEPNNDKNLSLWVQAVRRSENPPSIEAVIERVGYWRAYSNTIDSVYYLYVFYMLQALDGSVLARQETKRYIEECKTMARSRVNRTKSLEWCGSGKGIRRLIYHSELGEWDKSKDFWTKTNLLARVEGRIAHYDGPQSGQIEVANTGLFAFFVPGHDKSARNATIGESNTQRIFTRDDLGRSVDFYLGFSYDGLRAWEVKELTITRQ